MICIKQANNAMDESESNEPITRSGEGKREKILHTTQPKKDTAAPNLPGPGQAPVTTHQGIIITEQ
jgi:hypothetical protein